MPRIQRVTRDAVAYVRLTTAEKRDLREQARVAGLTLSAYGRQRLLGHPVVASADPGTIRKLVAASGDAAVIRELRRLGGLLKLVHRESGGAYSKTTDAALTELESALRKRKDRAAASTGKAASSASS